jgi:hypothetical protein
MSSHSKGGYTGLSCLVFLELRYYIYQPIFRARKKDSNTARYMNLKLWPCCGLPLDDSQPKTINDENKSEQLVETATAVPVNPRSNVQRHRLRHC